MDKAQCFGSSSSYARKYALNALFLIDDTADIDTSNDHKDKPKEKPMLTPERFKNAIEAVKTGEYSAQDLKDKYNLKEVQLEKLNKLL